MKLHLATDEKVIDRCIESFEEVFPDQNKFVIILKSGSAPRYVKNKKAIFVKYGTKEFWRIIGDARQYESVILHSFNLDFARFVKKIKHNNVHWIEWGADMYVKMLAPRGYQLFYEKDTDWRFSHVKLPKLLYRLVKSLDSKLYLNYVLKALKYVQYFVPDSMEDEYPMLISYFPQLSHLKYANFYYYPIEEIVKSHNTSTKLGDNIIIGNSSSVSGNHKEAFELLSRLNITSKVIVPLSYGNMRYAEYVKECGKNLIGDGFFPITEFMSLPEYNRILSSCYIFIYPHYRQEAVGNILAALYMGGKVFLNRRNPLLAFYKKIGLVIFDMQDITNESITNHLSEEDVRKNRKILLDNYSKELQLNLIKHNF